MIINWVDINQIFTKYDINEYMTKPKIKYESPVNL